MAKENLQKNGGIGKGTELLLGLAFAQAEQEKQEEKLKEPLHFLTSTIEEFQGGRDEEAMEHRKYGSRNDLFLPYGFDNPDDGLKNVEDILLFLDDVLTQNDWEGPDKGLSGGGLNGLGHLCRLMWSMIGGYRTDTFNSLDHLQRLMREKAKQEGQDQAEQEVDHG